MSEEDIDAGWDDVEPGVMPPPRPGKPVKLAPPAADPGLDELDASWDAPLPRAARPPKRQKERKREQPARSAPEPPPIVRPRPAAAAPSLTEARRLAKKRASQRSEQRKAEKRAKKEEKKRRQAERRAEALAKNKATARGPRAPEPPRLTAASVEPRRRPEPQRRPEPRRRTESQQRPEPASDPHEDTLSRGTRSEETRQRRARRRRRQESAPKRGGLPQRFAVLAVALVVLLVGVWWLFLRTR